jgi:hypothetical protein
VTSDTFLIPTDRITDECPFEIIASEAAKLANVTTKLYAPVIEKPIIDLPGDCELKPKALLHWLPHSGPNGLLFI